MRRRAVGRPARPSLARTAARTAVISGTATAVSGKVAANQAARAQQTVASPASTPQPAGAPPADTGSSDEAFSDDAYEQLKKLGEMREAGILADEEFQAKKAQILAL